MTRLVVRLAFEGRSSFVRAPQAIVEGRGTGFHALQVVLQPEDRSGPRVVYVAADPRRHAGSGTIEVPARLAEALEIAEGALVDVHRVPAERVAASVVLEPEDVDDWEKLERNAQWVEENLVQQIQVLTVGCKFPVFLRGSAICFLRCVQSQQQEQPFVRIGKDSEVAIAPKVRRNKVQGNTVSLQIADLTSRGGLIPGEAIQSVAVALLNPADLDEIQVKHGAIVIVKCTRRKLRQDPRTEYHGSSDRILPDSGNYIFRALSSQACPKGTIMVQHESRESMGVPLRSFVQVANVYTEVAFEINLPERPIQLTPCLFYESEELRDVASLLMNQSAESRKVDTEMILDAFTNTQINLSFLGLDIADISIPLTIGSTVLTTDDHGQRHLLQVTAIGNDQQVSSDHIVNSGADSGKKLKLSTAIPYVLVDPSNPKLRIQISEGNLFLRKIPNPLESFPGLEQLGAVQPIVEKITPILRPYLDFNLFSKIPSELASCLGHCFLTGSSGCGKSSIAGAIAKHFQAELLAYVIWVPCGELVSERALDIENRIREILYDARLHQPTLIVFDDMDKLLPSADDHDPHHNLRVRRLVEAFSDAVSEQCAQVALLAVANSRSTLHASLQIPGLFDKEIAVGVPDKAARESIISALCKIKEDIIVPEKHILEMVASKTEGCLPMDLKQLVERAIHESLMLSSLDETETSNLQHSLSAFELALDGFSSASSKNLRLLSSETGWEDIGGLEEVRRVIQETLELPSKYSTLFQNIPLKSRSGILLYGPPGCGKTMLGSAVAKECGLNFISVKGPELLNKYIGSSEQSVRDVFHRAASAAPCVVFFDEFDSIAPRRGGDSTGVTDRVVNQLLCHLDGVEGRSGVYILAASSRPDLIDPALLRPGRLDKSLYCGIPDQKARKSILEILVNKIDISDSVDLNVLAQQTENFTGADLQALVTTAQITAIHERIEQADHSRASEEGSSFQIELTHFQQALKDSRISVSDKERHKYESIYANFVGTRQDCFDLASREGQLKQRTIQK